VDAISVAIAAAALTKRIVFMTHPIQRI